MSRWVAALLCLALLVGSLVVPVAAVAQPQDGDRRAELEVRQPHYIEEDVRTTNDGGDRVYHAKSGHLELYPRQFAHENVADYGVEPADATLSYDSTTGGYTLETDANGTHEVYWTVIEEYQEGNETRTERVTYTAQVRVEDTQDMMVVGADHYREQQQKAEKWDRAIAEAEHHAHANYLLQFSPVTPEEVIFLGLDAYRTTRSPMSWFSGGAAAYFILIVSSLGALAVFVLQMGYHTAIVALLYRRLNIFEATESHEGEVAERTEALEKREGEQALQNQTFNDIWYYDDEVADAFRDLGENPHAAVKHFSANALLPSRAATEKIRAMGQCGYTGVIEEGTAPDGGDDEFVDVHEVRIAPDDEVESDTPTIDLTEVTPDLARDAFDLGSETLRQWDRSSADYDREKADLPDEHLSLEELIAEAQLDERYFPGKQSAGEHILEFLEHVREHPYTQDDGTPDTTRAVLNEWLRTAQYLRDRYDFPATQFQIEAVEAALLAYDPEAEARQTLDDVKEGKYA